MGCFFVLNTLHLAISVLIEEAIHTTRTNASKGSACTDGLGFAFSFNLGLGCEKMISNRCFSLKQTSLHPSPSTSLCSVGYIENVSGDEPITACNYQRA